jgi:arsenate reductase-like glutaredoxin family protein
VEGHPELACRVASVVTGITSMTGSAENRIRAPASETREGDIVLYSSDQCPYSVEAKAWLQTNGFPFRDCNLSVDRYCEAEFLSHGATNQNGKPKPFLPEPYNWKTYPKMNAGFWQKHQATTHAQSREMLRERHAEVMVLIEAFSNDELFSKVLGRATPVDGDGHLGRLLRFGCVKSLRLGDEKTNNTSNHSRIHNPYSAVSNLGNTGIKSSLLGLRDVAIHTAFWIATGSAALAMTQSEIVCVFGLFMYSKLLTAENPFKVF